MFIRLTLSAALVFSAAFVFSASTFAQAPIIDASMPDSATGRAAVSNEPAVDTTVADNDAAQGELFYQLQLLQQEVMQLRGIVEEQSHELKQLKDQNLERYIDLDRRLGELASSGADTKAVESRPVSQPSKPLVALKGEKAAYDSAYQLVTSRRFDAALDAFKQLLMDFPDGKYAPNSYYWVGELYQVITPQDLEAARQAFTQLLEQYPDHAKVPDAMYKLGKVHFLKGNRSKSRDYLEQVISQYSNGPNASTADKARLFLNTNF